MRPKILIVEDDPIIAKDLEGFLQKFSYTTIGLAYDSETALDMIHTRSPDLVLLDINIDGQKDGIEVAHIIKANYEIPFLFITSFSDEVTLNRAKDTNPSGYIVKPFEEKNLKASIAIALHNYNSYVNHGQLNLERINQMAMVKISEREFEIISDITNGLSSSDIAKNHFISINTVKFHLKNIYQKMEVSGKSELLARLMK